MKQRLRRSARGLRCNNERRARFEGAKAYIRHAKGVHQHRKLCREGQFFSGASRTSAAETVPPLCQVITCLETGGHGQ